MKKVLITVITAVLLLTLFTALSACNDNDVNTGDSPEVTVTELKVVEFPKQYYKPSENIDLKGGTLLATFSDNTQKEVLFTDFDVTTRNYGTNVDGRLDYLEVTYGGVTVKIPYYVSSTVTGTVFEQSNLQTVYSVNTPVDYGSAFFKLYKGNTFSSYKLNSNSALNSYNYEFTGFDTSKAGEFTMTFRFYASIYTVSYKVVDHVFVKEALLNSDIPDKFLLNEQLDYSSISVLQELSDGSQKTVIATADMFSGFSTAESGVFTMTFTCGGEGYEEDCVISENIEYTVYGEDGFYISVMTSSSDNSFYVGDTLYDSAGNFHLDNTYLVATYSDDTTKAIALTESSVRIDEDTFSTALGGIFKLDIYYTSPSNVVYRAQLTYEVVKRYVSIQTFNTDTIVKQYNSGDSFDFGTATVRINFDDGTYSDYLVSEQYNMDVDKRSVSIFELITNPNGGTDILNILEYGEIDTLNPGTYTFYIGANKQTKIEYTVS